MKCETCKYVNKVDASEFGGVPMVGKKLYVCKRFPPIPVMIPVQGDRGAGLGMQTTSPVVNPEDYCHEWAGDDISLLEKASQPS